MSKVLTTQEAVSVLINISYKAQENGLLTIKESVLLDDSLRTLITDYDNQESFLSDNLPNEPEEKKVKVVKNKKEIEF